MKKYLFVFCAIALTACQHNEKPCSYYRSMAETPVYFDFGSSQIQEQSKVTLDEGLIFLKGHRFRRIQLDGFADEIGGESDFNNDLSLKRAETVRDYLINQGIAEKRIVTVVGHGVEKGKPRKSHRRVDITVK